MKKEMTLQAPATGFERASECVKPVSRLLLLPLALHLVHVQTALLFAVFPADCPLLLRGVCCAWLVSALLWCRRAMAGGAR